MIVVLAIDALEFEKVEEFNCQNLKQQFYGKTDISDFSQPRTLVLWSSFMTGQNKEKEVLAKGDKEMWNTRIPAEKTFFSHFSHPLVLDLPGYNYELAHHQKERELLKSFFETDAQEKKDQIKKQYNQHSLAHHKKIKQDFLQALENQKENNYDFILGYFSVIDVIGHLNFGNNLMMKMLYQEMDELVIKIREKIKNLKLIVLSDHGMKAIGQFGDHSEYGFWSTNFQQLEKPKITDFAQIIKELK